MSGGLGGLRAGTGIQDRRHDERQHDPRARNWSARLGRVEGFFDRRPDNAEIVTAGRGPRRPGFFMKPAVVAGLKQKDEMIQDEIFGPAITVQPFTSEEKAIEWANGTRYGLASLCGRATWGERYGSRRHSGSAAARSTTTSRSRPRCRTEVTSSPATARTCRSTRWRLHEHQARDDEPVVRVLEQSQLLYPDAVPVGGEPRHRAEVAEGGRGRGVAPAADRAADVEGLGVAVRAEARGRELPAIRT